MSSPENPQWNFLPDQPENFFGLEDGFTLKDLKRTYRSWLKVFKPEKEPDAFMKIRAAYEKLEGDLRYGKSTPVFKNTPPPPEPETSETTPPQEQAAQQKLKDQIQKDPMGVLSRLSELDHKTPSEFYWCAALSPLAPGAAPHAMVSWICQGIDAYPDHEGLYELLTAYVHGPVALEALPGLLEILADCKNLEGFYHNTEKLWLKLLKELSFDTFADLLARCESKRRLTQNTEARVVFYLRILRPACWKAPAAWVAEKRQFIEDHVSPGDDYLDDEIEFLDMLLAYLKLRDDFLDSKKGFRKKWDQTLQTYCEKGYGEADNAYLALQFELLASEKETLKSFHGIWDTESPEVSYLNNWIGHGVAYRILPEEDELDDEAKEQLMRDFMRRLEKLTDSSFFGISLMGAGFLYIGLLLMGGIGCPIWVVQGFDLPVTWLTWVLGLAWAAIFYWKIRTYTVDWVRDILSYILSLGCYKRTWKKELVKFLKETRIDLFEAEQLAAYVNEVEEDVTNGELLVTHTADDYSLRVWYTAYQFSA